MFFCFFLNVIVGMCIFRSMFACKGPILFNIESGFDILCLIKKEEVYVDFCVLVKCSILDVCSV